MRFHTFVFHRGLHASSLSQLFQPKAYEMHIVMAEICKLHHIQTCQPFFNSNVLTMISHKFPAKLQFSAIPGVHSYCTAEKSQFLIDCQLPESLQKYIIYSFQPFALRIFGLWLKCLCKTAAPQYACKIT